jgi:hypothetical protein
MAATLNKQMPKPPPPPQNAAAGNLQKPPPESTKTRLNRMSSHRRNHLQFLEINVCGMNNFLTKQEQEQDNGKQIIHLFQILS